MFRTRGRKIKERHSGTEQESKGQIEIEKQKNRAVIPNKPRPMTATKFGAIRLR